MIYCVLGEEMLLFYKKCCDHNPLLSQDLSLTELACAPQVSPTASYQEIIQVRSEKLATSDKIILSQVSPNYSLDTKNSLIASGNVISNNHYVL